MINFNSIPDSLPQEIAAVRNSGVVLSWMLAKVFHFSFDLADFYKVVNYDPNEGINGESVITYTINKGLYFYDFPKGASVNANLFRLKEKGIVTCITYSAYGKDKSGHMSILENISGNEFSMLYGNPNYTDLSKVEGFHMFFISSLPDISKYVKVIAPPEASLNRYPPISSKHSD